MFAPSLVVARESRALPGSRSAADRLERRETGEYILLSVDVAHRADAPDIAVQPTERCADLDTEIVEDHPALGSSLGHGKG
jgi:hypothetical protein